MNDNLFNIPVTKSPRLLWMERHNISIAANATTGTWDVRLSSHIIGRGPTQDDALVAAAKSLNIPLWNEQ